MSQAPAPGADRLARLVLNRLTEPGDPRVAIWVRYLGAQEVLARVRAGERLEGLGPDARTRSDEVDPAEFLQATARAGLRFLVPGDEEWPAALDDLEHCPPLHRRGDVPLCLWARGSGHLAALCEHSVAVVGSRSATTYGASVAGQLAGVVAAAGWSVVSGGAFGIDQAAHRGALAVHADTVAVVASGADRPYPLAHAALLDHVADGGVVVSEAPPGAAPMRVRFLARNRILAALTGGTVVVEAAMRSGALNTAHWADLLGRDVMGVPGPVNSAPSAGVHQLIRGRGAVLVTRGEEVLETVGGAGEHLLAHQSEPDRPRDRLAPEDQQVIDAVPVLRPAALPSVASAAGLAEAQVAASLDRLEGQGLVERHGDRWRLAEGLDPAG